MVRNNTLVNLASVLAIIAVAVGMVVIFDKPQTKTLDATGDLSFYYLATNEQAHNAEINSLTIHGKKQNIYSFALPQNRQTPFVEYDLNNNLLVYLGDSGSFLVNPSTGQADVTEFNRIISTALLSPTGSYLAFNKAKNKSIFDTELVIKEKNGEERTLDSGSMSEDGEGMLTPLGWSPDEQTLYANRVALTQGDIIGLYEIDTQTMEVQRISSIDELGISRYVFDRSGNVYGAKPIIRFSEDEEPAKEIFRVLLSTNEVTEFTLISSGINGMQAVDPTGTYIAYSYSTTENGPGLWIYDTVNETEQMIIGGVVPVAVLGWKNNTIVYQVSNVSGPTVSSIYSYYYPTNTNTALLTLNAGQLQLIDWVQN